MQARIREEGVLLRINRSIQVERDRGKRLPLFRCAHKPAAASSFHFPYQAFPS